MQRPHRWKVKLTYSGTKQFLVHACTTTQQWSSRKNKTLSSRRGGRGLHKNWEILLFPARLHARPRTEDKTCACPLRRAASSSSSAAAAAASSHGEKAAAILLRARALMRTITTYSLQLYPPPLQGGHQFALGFFLDRLLLRNAHHLRPAHQHPKSESMFHTE